jgi:uridine kinase
MNTHDRLEDEIGRVADSIARRGAPAGESALLVGISGIDASGKGFAAALLDDLLRRRGFNVALLHADDWLELPSVRFDPADPAAVFYRNALRLAEMFSLLVEPLRQRGSIGVTVPAATETGTAFYPKRFDFRDIDVILLEGIFIFRKGLAGRFDIRIWIECSRATALRRAVARSQEGLRPADTKAAYRRIYFPAQDLHIERDDPCAECHFLLQNE